VAEGPGDNPGSAVVVITKDMGISHADFFRIIPLVLKGERYHLDATGVDIARQNARIQIQLGAESARRLGSFALPRTRVELRFDGCSDEAIQAFVANFDTRFRRGGG